MSLKFTILGCGTSGGVPRIGNQWGACDPNNPKTPAWPAYDEQSRQTMVFGTPSQVVSDPRRAFVDLWASIDG